MANDLKSMSRKQLEKLRADIDKAISRLEKKEMSEALAAAEKVAKAHGFSLEEITKLKPKRTVPKVQKAAGKPKFANPEDRSQTWSGRGRQPDWYKSALAAGRTPEQLSIR